MAVVAVVIMVIVVMAMVSIGVLVIALFAMEDQEIHAERIEGRDEHASQHRKVGETGCSQMAFVHRFNDAVFGVEA